MTDRQHGRVWHVPDWLSASLDPLWLLMIAYTFGVYAVLGFEIAVVMTLLLILREVARP